MNILFLGSPAFAVTILNALAVSDHRLVAVVTGEDKPRGRHRTPQPTAVKARAEELLLPVHAVTDVNDASLLETVKSYGAEAAVVASFGKLLKQPWLTAFPYGCINVHGSLLPAYRGATPIQSALREGRQETGITIMQMSEALDAGDMYLQRALAIDADENYGSLHDRLGRLGGEMIVEVLTALPTGSLTAKPQDEVAATYCTVLTRNDELIDWQKPGAAIHNQIRSLSPAPGAVAYWGDNALKILATTFEAGVTSAAAGTLLGLDKRAGVAVAVKGGILWLREVKPAGKKAMAAQAWYNGLRTTNLVLRNNPVAD